MPVVRYERATQNDAESRVDGDSVFLGVNAKLRRELLEPGWCPAATNKVFATGAADTRPGFRMPVSHRIETASLPANTFIRGSGVYSDPDGVEYLVHAHGARAYFTREGSSGFTIAYTGLDTSDRIEVVQAFNQVLLFRGPGKVPWVWDGDINTTFVQASQVDPGAGLSPIPGATTAELMANRLFIPYSRDQIAVSDLLDYTAYDAALNDFNVNSGSDDAIVRVFPFTNNSLLVFKDQSTHLISNIYGDLSEVRLDQINGEIGCAARRSVAMVGGDVFFLASDGVYRVQQIIQGRLQTGATPVSDPITPLIRRINENARGLCVGAVLGRYYYLAVPLDTATRPNALLVYDTVTDAWQGIHKGPVPQSATDAGLFFDNLLISDWGGEKRLYGMYYGPPGGSDNAQSGAFLLYDGVTDQWNGVEYPVADQVETRGYTFKDHQPKVLRRISFNVETWSPSLTVDLVTEGHNEATSTGPALTKSRTRYYTHGVPDWDPSNTALDHATPRREDYSVDLSVPIVLDPPGVEFDARQTTLEKRAVSATARAVSLRIANTQGTCALTATTVEAINPMRTLKTHV